MNSRLCSALALLALAWGAAGPGPAAAGTTAFDLAREGDKVIPPLAKDKLLRMQSEKSAVSLTPDVWHIDYLDPTVAFKTTEVTFVNGKVKEITRPKHVMDAFSGSRQLSWRRLKINSDRALAIALKEPALKKVHLQATQFWLERTAQGATWKIRFWAARKAEPLQSVQIGDVQLSAETGEVLKADLQTKNAE
jgi:hypothetical protein